MIWKLSLCKCRLSQGEEAVRKAEADRAAAEQRAAIAEAKTEQLQQALDEARTHARALERQQGGARGAASGSGTAGYDALACCVAVLALQIAATIMSSTCTFATMQKSYVMLCAVLDSLSQSEVANAFIRRPSLDLADSDHNNSDVLLAHRSTAQTRLLEQELSAARDEAAAATAHMRQFQTLATSSDQALRDMEASVHARCHPLISHRAAAMHAWRQSRSHLRVRIKASLRQPSSTVLLSAAKCHKLSITIQILDSNQKACICIAFTGHAQPVQGRGRRAAGRADDCGAGSAC